MAGAVAAIVMVSACSSGEVRDASTTEVSEATETAVAKGMYEITPPRRVVGIGTGVAVVPEWLETPHVPRTLEPGRCQTLVPGASLENTTGVLPNAYRRVAVTTGGRSVWAEHWGSRSGAQVLVIAQVHGDECVGAWVAREIRERPPQTWGVWLIASMNPDGLVAHTRRNGTNVDLNRDGLLQRSPEVRGVLEFAREIQFVMSVHVHAPLGWVGDRNNGVAGVVSREFAARTGLSVRGSGSGKGFLWEGLERVLPGHPSVLLELPALSAEEAPAVFARGDGVTASEAEVAFAASAFRDALAVAMGP